MITIANANALHIPLPDESVQCIVTSPPYWALRSYLGNDDDLKHMEIGLENTPAEYVAHIVAVMRECWRVLRPSGTLWLVIGDSYAGGGVAGSDKAFNGKQGTNRGSIGMVGKAIIPDGLKPKDLCGIPWRVAFALQDDGWYLRSDIIWCKPNPMPESVTDRPTKSHEYVFLLTKQARYFYDAEAIKEPASDSTVKRSQQGAGVAVYDSSSKAKSGVWSSSGQRSENGRDFLSDVESGRNRRSVWTIATSPYSGAHFATFPPALIEPMILAGTSARGECPHCGKAWVRVVERNGETKRQAMNERGMSNYGEVNGNALNYAGGHDLQERTVNTIGWRPSCSCPPHEPIPQLVLDPFAGSGTTGQVAVKHGRRAVLLDLNTKYIDLQFERTNGVQVTMPL